MNLRVKHFYENVFFTLSKSETFRVKTVNLHTGINLTSGRI
jgi:hypothetical protein